MDIQEHLRTFQQPWKPGFDTRVAALPAPWATLIGAHVKGGGDHQERQRLQDELTDALHASTPAERDALAAAFFPQFPALAARTLDALLTRHP